MHENKFNTYRVPSGLLILFLEKALTLIHMETHLNEVSETFTSKIPARSPEFRASLSFLTRFC
jgi:hypothetical protein